jgi:N-acetylneuraminic acid mutarotase
LILKSNLIIFQKGLIKRITNPQLSVSAFNLSSSKPLTFFLSTCSTFLRIKKNVMLKKIVTPLLSGLFSFKVYFPFLLVAFSYTLTSSSCKKDDGDDEDIIGNWKRSSEFEGVGRTEAVSFQIGTKLYIGGGYDGSDRLKDFWSYDQTLNTWIKIADFPGVARSSAVAFAVNGKGYVGTGYDDNDERLKDFWEYDPALNTWKQIADFAGTARYGAVAFSLGNKGYVTCGYDGNYLKDMYEYDPASNTWIQRASLGGSKRSDAVAFVHNGLAYVLTGFNNGSYLTDSWVYNPATNTWAEKRKLNSVNDDEEYDDDYGDNIIRSNASIFLMNNKAYLTNGNRSGIIGTTWEYDIASDTWAQKTSFEGSAREGGIGFSLNNRGYFTCGNNGSFRFDDMWEFFPETEQDDNDN